ncbi:MAG: HAMP domain-containing histidine kinase, partial [Candidatus Obscuribacterales bacterium]|nr:HAMP domain-containing histidine kinase [Candidatus Obscuribacterales bacterium]
TWRQHVADALKEQDFAAFAMAHPLLEDQSRMANELFLKQAQSSPLQITFDRIRRRLNHLLRGSKDAIKRLQQMSIAEKSNLFELGEKRAMEVEVLLFRAQKLESKELDSSYDLAAKLRAESTVLLTAAALADILLILSILILGMRLIERISLLNEKAAAFTRGEVPKAEMRTKDELAYLERNLCEVTTSIRQAEIQRQNLMALINHDLRTPLSSVLAGFELLEEGVFGNLQADELSEVKRCQRELQELLQHINDLLDLERLEGSAFEINTATVELAALLEESISKAKIRWKDRNIEMEFQCPDEELYVEADINMLRRILNALVDNACQASPESGKVILNLKSSQEEARISISDTGNGIALSLQKQLFERFRFENEAPLIGLGLPLAYRFCKVQGATLSFNSKQNGSCFTVVFPLNRSSKKAA